MGKYLKKFETQSAYEAAQSSLILPNVSLTVDNNTVHYNPSTPPTPTAETRVVAIFNVEDISYQTYIIGSGTENCFSAIEIDGTELSSVEEYYQFNTTGEHTVKYTLSDPTSICDGAFGECHEMKSVIIPNGVTNIGGGAFGSAYGLESVMIPSSVTYIGDMAFDEDGNLINVTIFNPIPPTLEGFMVFNYVPGPIYVPSGSVNAYKTASEYWIYLAEKIQAIP